VSNLLTGALGALYWTEAIDDLRIYNRGLSGSEIPQLGKKLKRWLQGIKQAPCLERFFCNIPFAS
jgi:hypothetical protein